MMKRKFLAVVLPIVGCATLVGSGFSAWYFGTTANVPLGWDSTVDVTPDISKEDGVVKIANKQGTEYLQDGEHFILDQGTVDTSKPAEYAKVGIAFVEAPSEGTQLPTVIPDSSTTKWAVDVTYNNDNQSLANLYNNEMEVVVTMTISVHNILEKYIVLDTNQKFDLTSTDTSAYPDTELSFNPSTTQDNGYTVYTLQYTPTIKNVDLTNVTWTIELDMSTEYKANKLFSYEVSTVAEDSKVKKPTSSAELKTMSDNLKEIVDGTGLKFAASVAIVDR